MEETRTTHPTADRAAAKPIEGNDTKNAREFKNTISIDLAAYMPLLESTEASDDEKLELLRTLYAIMASFVDMGFNVEPGPCGQVGAEGDPSTQALRNHVHSSHHQFTERFEETSAQSAGSSREGVEA
ncbi:MAG: hypothetical protein AAFY19_07530 [Pseudomonadota bacterium]